MEFFTPLVPGATSGLGMALIASSATPLLLVGDDLVVKAASGSFCRDFALDLEQVVGTEFSMLGDGEWGVPQLRSLLRATASGKAAIDAYEFDLGKLGQPARILIINAHRIDYPGSDGNLVVIAISDVTEIRQTQKLKDDAVREKQILMLELQHRVANSLQIIASVLMQNAKKVQTDEARNHLHNAHHRVMSIATLQRLLAIDNTDKVQLQPYFSQLCETIGASMIYDPALVKLNTIVDDSAVSAEASVSLGLIVTELVINSLKHAFPEHESSGTIIVEYWSCPTGWRLTVEDDGIGMPADHETQKPGLGTGIIEALSKQLNATVSIAAKNPFIPLTHVT